MEDLMKVIHESHTYDDTPRLYHRLPWFFINSFLLFPEFGVCLMFKHYKEIFHFQSRHFLKSNDIGSSITKMALYTLIAFTFYIPSFILHFRIEVPFQNLKSKFLSIFIA